MSAPAELRPTFPAMGDDGIDKVARLQCATEHLSEPGIRTDHLLHAGMYARTMKLPAGKFLVGALVQVDTIVIFHGRAEVFTGQDFIQLSGYHVIPAAAMRKQVFIAHEDCHITAIFATDAKSVEEAENQATREAASLMSRREVSQNLIQITGENPCLTP